jgi:hypothetical protein
VRYHKSIGHVSPAEANRGLMAKILDQRRRTDPAFACLPFLCV